MKGIKKNIKRIIDTFFLVHKHSTNNEFEEAKVRDINNQLEYPKENNEILEAKMGAEEVKPKVTIWFNSWKYQSTNKCGQAWPMQL